MAPNNIKNAPTRWYMKYASRCGYVTSPDIGRVCRKKSRTMVMTPNGWRFACAQHASKLEREVSR